MKALKRSEANGMTTYEIRNGRLALNGEDLPIRRSIVQAGLAIYAGRTGHLVSSRNGSRFIPRAAAEEILALERRASLAILEITIEEAIATL